MTGEIDPGAEYAIATELTVLARHLLRHGNAEDAIALLDSALAIQPDATDIAALQCEAAHRVGRDEEAHMRIIGLLPQVSPAVRAELEVLDAKVLLALGRRDEAEAAYRRVFPDLPPDQSADAMADTTDTFSDDRVPPTAQETTP